MKKILILVLFLSVAALDVVRKLPEEKTEQGEDSNGKESNRATVYL